VPKLLKLKRCEERGRGEELLGYITIEILGYHLKQRPDKTYWMACDTITNRGLTTMAWCDIEEDIYNGWLQESV